MKYFFMSALILGYHSLVFAIPQSKEFDHSRIVGHFSFSQKISQDKVYAAAEYLKTEFPDFEKILVRKDGPQSMGLDFEFVHKSKMASQQFRNMIVKSLEAKFGDPMMDRWDISSEVFWVKKAT